MPYALVTMAANRRMERQPRAQSRNRLRVQKVIERDRMMDVAEIKFRYEIYRSMHRARRTLVVKI
jgi:hypothetical protein